MRQIFTSLTGRYCRSRFFVCVWMNISLLSIIALCGISSFIRLRMMLIGFLILLSFIWFIGISLCFIRLSRISGSFISCGFIVGWLINLLRSIRLSVVRRLSVCGSWSFISLLNFIRSIVTLTMGLMTVRLGAITLRLTICFWLSISLRITTISDLNIAVYRIITTITVSEIVAIAISVLTRIWEIKSLQSIWRVSTAKIFSKTGVCTFTSMRFLSFHILIRFFLLAMPITTTSIAAESV